MSSCLGIYVDKNLIKYAKLKKVRDTFKVEAFNVEVFEDLETALKKVISETNSYKVPISINISNELYNYFDVFSMLEKKDITKSLDIEFEMLCSEKGYNKKALESRYILMDNKEDYEKYKALYISANKKEIDEKIKILSDYKLYTMAPVSTSITNLIEANENENIAIVNIENETKITTIIDGEITRVDVLNSGMEAVVEKINKLEMSWKKAYDVCKNITIYDHEVQSLDEHENEYIDIVFYNVLVHFFENQLSHSIIFDICKYDVNKFIKDNNQLLNKRKNYCWPIDYDNIEELISTLEKEEYNYYIISSSYGLEGWVLAKKVKLLKVKEGRDYYK